MFLLGVLGEVDAAVGGFVGEEEGQGPRWGDVKGGAGDDGGAAVSVGEEMDVAVAGEEMGVAVARGDVIVEEAREEKVKKRKARGEMGVAVARGDVIFEEERQDKVTVARKKKKARGDEFDAIFGALENKPPAKRAKKKRKVKGDEFDDIFGGL